MPEQNRPQENLQLKFDGGITSIRHQIPASVLTKTLEGLQRSIHLLAMQSEGIEVRQKDRISIRIENKYPVLCSPPQTGSLEMTATLGDKSSDIFALDDCHTVSDLFKDVCKYIQENASNNLVRLIPDKIRRSRLLDAMLLMIPKAETGINLFLIDHTGTQFLSSERLSQGIRLLKVSSRESNALQTITGRLIKIHFDEKKITLLYPPTKTELDCFYNDEAESLLLENPRNHIQVTGEVILDKNGHPKRLVKVDDIHELDLSPFSISKFIYSNKEIFFHKPLELTPQLDETEQIILIEYPEYSINIAGYTREDIKDSIENELEIIWRNYALEDDINLTIDAQTLKRKILSSIRSEAI